MPKTRFLTGIRGLDDLLRGGFHEHSEVIVNADWLSRGDRVLREAAWTNLSEGVNVLYMGVGVDEPRVISSMEEMGFDIRKYVENGLFRFLEFPKFAEIPPEALFDTRAETLAIGGKKIGISDSSMARVFGETLRGLEIRKSIVVMMDSLSSLVTLLGDQRAAATAVTSAALWEKRGPSFSLIKEKTLPPRFETTLRARATDWIDMKAVESEGRGYRRQLRVTKLHGEAADARWRDYAVRDGRIVIEEE